MTLVRIALAAIVLVHGVGVACALAAHAPSGWRWLSLAWALHMLVTLLPIVPVVALAVCVAIVSAWRRRWRTALAVVGIGGIWAAAAIGSAKGGMAICERSWQRIAQNGAPVVAALTRYEREHGHPPDSLDALIPAYFDRLPDTGVACHSGYKFHREESGSPPWVLFVYVAHSIGHAPRVEFWPGGRYPASIGTQRGRGQGVWYFPIGSGWAYALPDD